jgi:hypothetical protein
MASYRFAPRRFLKGNELMTDHERDLSRQLFGGEQKSMGPVQAIKEAFLTIAPGLKDFGPQVKQQLQHMGAHGAHELANALFGNGAFVLYPRDGTNIQSKEGPEQAQDGQHHKHGGHRM